MLTRRHIVQVVLRRPPPLFTSRGIFTSISRPICIAFPKSRVPRARAKRLFTTNNNSNIEPPKFQRTISPDEYKTLVAHANKCWPPPPSVPPNWSCTWSEWEALLSYYWFSPYYLMLPQIEMHVNLQYGIRGETRPRLFSNERDSFVFTIIGSNKYYLFDGPFSALYRIRDVRNDHQLVELMNQGDDAIVARLKVVEESQEGLSAISRIMRRDETVIPLLAKKFLYYTPVPTTPGMEGSAVDWSPEQETEFTDYISRWQRGEMEEPEDDASDDKELQELNEEVERLTSRLNSLLDKSQSKENTKQARKPTKQGEAAVTPVREEMEEARKLTEKEEEEERLTKEMEEAMKPTEEEEEEDIPPEELERVQRETMTLKEKIDEVLKEIENFPVEPHQVEAFNDMVATAKSIRESLDELHPTDSHAMAIYLARSLEQNFRVIKDNPKAIDSLIRNINRSN